MRKLLVVLALLGLVACSDDDGDGDAPSTTTTIATPAPTTTTTSVGGTTTTIAFGNTDVSTPADTEQGQLTNVTVGAHDGFVRVVFTFGNLVPGYSVKKAEPPFRDGGQGAVVEVDGEGHLAVRLTARAHDDEGKATVSTKRIAGPANTSVEEVVQVDDFEGVVNYVIGMTAQKPFKVFTLKSPARLVIDIQSP
jgi:hypothetical protein